VLVLRPYTHPAPTGATASKPYEKPRGEIFTFGA